MAKAIVANAPHLDTRETRALDLYRHHGADIEEIAPDIYLVPSQAGERVYRVQYGAHEFCSCPDAEFHPDVSCKHLLAVAIAHAKRRAKRARCEGCGERFPRRDLCEVQESIRYFEGDLLCRSCWHASDAI